MFLFDLPVSQDETGTIFRRSQTNSSQMVSPRYSFIAELNKKQRAHHQ
jgi:hypothetical protein